MQSKSRSLLLGAVACGVLLMALPHGVEARGSKWEEVFGSLYADRAWQIIERCKALKKEDAQANADALFRAGVGASHGHLAVGVGEALRTIGSEWIKSSGFKKAVRKAMRGKDLRRKRNVALILGSWGHPLVDAHLAKCATSPRPPPVMEEALYMCGAVTPTEEHPFPKTDKAITKALKHKIPALRIAAYSAAGRRGARHLADSLAHAVKTDLSRYGGLYAVRALQRLGDDRGVAHFAEVATRAQRPETRNACLKAVVTLALPKDLDALETVVRSPDEASKLAAIIAIGTIYNAAAFTGAEPHPTLAEVPKRVRQKVTAALIDVACKDESRSTREAACMSLIRMGEAAREWVAPVMPSRVTSRNAHTRMLATKLCGALRLRDAEAPLRVACRMSDEPALRMLAARALERIRADVNAAVMLEAIADRRKAAKTILRPIEALGYMRARNGLDGLIALLDGDPWPEKGYTAIEETLERLTGHRFGRDSALWRSWLGSTKDPFDRAIPRIDRRAQRKAVVEGKLYGVRPEVELTMERGLQWLERQQNIDGTWLSNESGWGGLAKEHGWYTGVCLSAFTGAGYVPTSGRYRETVLRATEFLAATQGFDGLTPSDEVAARYDSTLTDSFKTYARPAIIDAYLAERSPLLRANVQHIVDVLSRTQTPAEGWAFWSSTIDMAVTAPAVVDLAIARSEGFEVPEWILDFADSALRRGSSDVTPEVELLAARSREPDFDVGARRSFQSRFQPLYMSNTERADKGPYKTHMITEEGMMARLFMGYERSHPLLIGGGKSLALGYPAWGNYPPGGARLRVHNYWATGSDAMFQLGGPFWFRWRDHMRRMFTAQQKMMPVEQSGSWDQDTTSSNVGRLEATALACLALQSYYRYPPFYAATDAK